MQLLAAATVSIVDRLRQIPTEFWINMAIGIFLVVLIVIVLRKVAQINKVVLGVGVFLVVTIVGFNWIYERNEPKWATPAVHWIGAFFPSKGTV